MKEAVVSRSSDTWGLGCVFLEMVSWILGGPQELRNFSSVRTSSSPGIQDDSFFSVKPAKLDRYEFSIKPSVTQVRRTGVNSPRHLKLALLTLLTLSSNRFDQYIDVLRSHAKCSHFIKDFLDLIQHKMLVVTATERVTSEALAEQLDLMSKRAADEPDSNYIRPDRNWHESQEQDAEQAPPATIVEAQVDTDVQDLIKESRIQLTERFTLRLGAPRVSIRRKENSIRRPAATVAPAQLKPESRSTANTLFTHVIDTTVRYSLGLAGPEADAKIRKVVFEISWQIQECIRQELNGEVDLASVLTITGQEDTWATTCQDYVKTTWNELGERFLVDLETLLGKSVATTG